MPASVPVRCTACSAKLKAPAGWTGRLATCPKCRSRFLVRPARLFEAPDPATAPTDPDIDLSALTKPDHDPLPADPAG